MTKPPYNIASKIIEKAQSIQLALFDVDGVLTDGSLFYTKHGEEVKRFNVLDGQGLKQLKENQIIIGIISAKQSAALTKRLNDLDIEHQLTGISDKLSAYQKLITSLNITTENTCFTGDDVIDIPIMQACGLAFSVDNGHYCVKEIADWVTPMSGGYGAVRAICDVINYAKQLDKQ